MARPPCLVATRPKPGIPLDVSVVAKLINTHTGNLTRVAKALGVARFSIQQLVDRYPDLQQTVKDQRERQIDLLEQSAFERATEGDNQLTIFLLKTQAKHRGYGFDENASAAQGVATAAFQFILNRSKSPVNPSGLSK